MNPRYVLPIAVAFWVTIETLLIITGMRSPAADLEFPLLFAGLMLTTPLILIRRLLNDPAAARYAVSVLVVAYVPAILLLGIIQRHVIAP